MEDGVKYVVICKDLEADVIVLNKITKGKLRWFGHTERMNEKSSGGMPRKNEILETGHVKSQNYKRVLIPSCLAVRRLPLMSVI